MTTKSKNGFVFSFAPSDATEGLADNFDGTVIEYRFEDYQYPNTNVRTPAVVLSISQDNPPAAEVVEQIYGIGGQAGDWEFSDDQKSIISGPKAQLNKSSNVYKLTAALHNAGSIPEDKMRSPDFGWLVGYSFHWDRKENATANQFRNADADEAQGVNKGRVRTILLPTRLVKAPTGTTVSKRNAPAKASPAVTTPAAASNGTGSASGEITDDMRNLLQAVIAGAEKPIQTRLLRTAISTSKIDGFHTKLKFSVAKAEIMAALKEEGAYVENEDGTVGLPE